VNANIEKIVEKQVKLACGWVLGQGFAFLQAPVVRIGMRAYFMDACQQAIDEALAGEPVEERKCRHSAGVTHKVGYCPLCEVDRLKVENEHLRLENENFRAREQENK